MAEKQKIIDKNVFQEYSETNILYHDMILVKLSFANCFQCAPNPVFQNFVFRRILLFLCIQQLLGCLIFCYCFAQCLTSLFQRKLKIIH